MSASRSVFEACLTVPTLLEIGMLRQPTARVGSELPWNFLVIALARTLFFLHPKVMRVDSHGRNFTTILAMEEA